MSNQLPGPDDPQFEQYQLEQPERGLELDLSALPPSGVSMGGDYGAHSVPQGDNTRLLRQAFMDGRLLAPYGLEDTGMHSDEKYQQLTGDIGMTGEGLEPASDN